MLRRSPTFTVVAALVVALGTTAVTTIFSIANALLLRPAPAIADPASVVAISMGDGRGPVAVSYPLFRDLRDGSHALRAVAAHAMMRAEVGLGVRPALGRVFTADEDRAPLAAPVVVVSYRYWQERLGGDRGAVGRTLYVDGTPFTLVGVARDARFASVAQAPVPYLFLAADQTWSTGLSLLARTSGDPAALAAAIRREIRALDPTLAPPRVLPYPEASTIGVLPQRVSASSCGRVIPSAARDRYATREGCWPAQ